MADVHENLGGCLAAKWGFYLAEMIGALMAGVWQPGNYLRSRSPAGLVIRVGLKDRPSRLLKWSLAAI